MKPISAAAVTCANLLLAALAGPPMLAAQGTAPAPTTPSILCANAATTSIINATLQTTPANLMLEHASGPELLDSSNDIIVVPARTTAVITLQLPITVPTSQITKIRFYQALSSNYAQVAPKLFAKVVGTKVILCDDNSTSTTDHTWSFGLEVNGRWYDPQIENDGGPGT